MRDEADGSPLSDPDALLLDAPPAHAVSAADDGEDATWPLARQPRGVVRRLPLPYLAGPPRLSRLEQMAAGTQQLSSHRRITLGILLDAARPVACVGRPVLQPLWSNEAMHRAYSIIRLMAELDRVAPLRCGDLFAARSERQLAEDLAASFRALDVERRDGPLPCSDELRTVARNLLDLFGPVAGQTVMRTAIERVALPAFKRKALVLAASELVVNALSHALNGEAAGWIAVTLCRIGPDAASLSVADNGRGLPCLWNRPTGIIADLAGLLGSEVVYRAREGGGTLAQIGFSLQA